MSLAKVEVGSTWIDLDKREKGRRIFVLATDQTHATCRSRNREVRIRLDRFGIAFKQATD